MMNKGLKYGRDIILIKHCPLAEHISEAVCMKASEIVISN